MKEISNCVQRNEELNDAKLELQKAIEENTILQSEHEQTKKQLENAKEENTIMESELEL